MRLLLSSSLLLLACSTLVRGDAPANDKLDLDIQGYFQRNGFPKAGRSLQDKIREADKFLKREVPTSNSVGFGVSIVYQDQTVLSKGYGLRDTTDPSSSVASTTMFQIGSVSKSMIAVAIGLLVEDKKVSWTDPVIKHLPWLRLFDKYAEKHVTIGNLLSMNSGFERSPDYSLFTGWLDERGAVEALEAMEPDYSLREKPAYGNINFQILGQMIEEVSGKPWYQYLHERVWEPLGMRHTFASAKSVPDDLFRKGVSKGHLVCGGEVRGPYDLVKSPLASLTPGLKMDYIAAGSIVSSPDDMATFMRMLLNKGRVGNATISNDPSTISEMITGKNVAAIHASNWTGLHYEPDGNTLSAGYGFDMVGNIMWNRPYVEKGGDTAVHHASFGFLPKDGLGVTFLSNSQGSLPLVNMLSTYVTGIFLDIPKPILDHQLKIWRAAAPAMEPPVPGAPACGFNFWKNPPRLALTAAEEKSLLGSYVATRSPGFLPPVSISRSWTSGEYWYRIGNVKATMFCVGEADGVKIFLPKGEVSLLGSALIVSFQGDKPTVLVGTAQFTKASEETAE